MRFDEASSTSVISRAQKFVIPVPAFRQRGEALVYPAGHGSAGRPILDFEGKPAGDRGIVFFNSKDQSWQAARGDGEGVIIINEVNDEQSTAISGRIHELEADPRRLSLEQLKSVLDFARDSLKLGDMYNSTRSFVASKLTPVKPTGEPPRGGTTLEGFGAMIRDDHDVNQAVFVPGRFAFAGPAATPQVFADGGVIVKQGDDVRGVQPEVFVRTYRLRDGTAITSPATQLKVQDKGR